MDPVGGFPVAAAFSCDLPTCDGLLMGWRRGEAGGVDMEEEREERAGEVRGEAEEGEEEGVVGRAGIVSLGLGRSAVAAMAPDDELEDSPGLRRDGGDELALGAGGGGSIAGSDKH